jgi:glycosyltransferase involved in cell wall biosynthesis
MRDVIVGETGPHEVKGAEQVKILFLLSNSKAPCGVEMFTRRLKSAWQSLGHQEESLAITGRVDDISAIWNASKTADWIAINFPIVAWKKILFMPILAFVIGLAQGKKTLLILHEWQDLDWRRRLFYWVEACLATRICFSSPSVREKFENGVATGWLSRESFVIPIPANIEYIPSGQGSPIIDRIKAERSRGHLILAHFGSIYPKKQADFVLQVAAELNRRGRKVFVVFVGGFVKGKDSFERDFHEKVERLQFADQTLVTDYVADEDRLSDIFSQIDCFVYRFTEGLTSRRASVLACLQTGKPVVVNAPSNRGEFDHHQIYRSALEQDTLQLLATDADVDQYAAALIALRVDPQAQPVSTFREGWREAAKSLEAGIGGSGPRLAELE